MIVRKIPFETDVETEIIINTESAIFSATVIDGTPTLIISDDECDNETCILVIYTVSFDEIINTDDKKNITFINTIQYPDGRIRNVFVWIKPN